MNADIQYFVDGLRRNWIREFKPYENFKITIYLNSPICLSSPFIFFDSILNHLIFLNNLKRDYYIAPTKVNLSNYLPEAVSGHPIDKIYNKENKLVVQSASCGILDPNSKKLIAYIYKRFEEKYTTFGGKIHINQGHFKSYAMQHVYIPTEKVVFFVRGDYQFIQKMLTNLIAIGDDIRIGYGFIRNIKYEKMQEDHSIVYNSLAMRPIPVEFLDEYDDIASLPYRSPYWDRKNVRLCAVPFSRVVFKKEYR